MIFNSTDLSVPSDEKATSGLPSAWATETLRKYLKSSTKNHQKFVKIFVKKFVKKIRQINSLEKDPSKKFVKKIIRQEKNVKKSSQKIEGNLKNFKELKKHQSNNNFYVIDK